MDKDILNIFTSETVIFFGAGVSMNSGIPIVYGRGSNEGIVDRILSKFNLSDKEIKTIFNSDLPFEAFMNNLTMGSDIFPLFNIFNTDKPNHTHKFMAKCAQLKLVKVFVTTNFDLLLESSLQNLNIDFKVYKNNHEFKSINWESETVKVIKLHGSVDDKVNLAITINKVANKNSSKVFNSVVEKIFNTGLHKNVLILGYSCSDSFDITPLILNKAEANNKNIYFIEHSNHEATEPEDVSIRERKNPFKFHKGYRYLIDTDKLILDLSKKTGINLLKKEIHESLEWKRVIDAWATTNLYNKSAVISKMFYDISEFLKAEKFLNLAISIENNSENEVILFLNLLPVLTGLSKYDEAEKLANKAITICQSEKYKHHLAQAYLNLGEIFLHKDKYNEALNSLLQAKDLMPKESDSDDGFKTRILATLGECYVCIGDFEVAKGYILLAKDQAILSGEIYSKAIIYRSLAKIHAHDAEFEMSIDFINQAISLSHELGLIHFEAASLIELGNYLRIQGGNSDFAIESNLKAIKLAREMKLAKLEAIATGNLGLNYIEIGEFEKAKESLRYAIDNTEGLLGITYKINYGVLNNNQEDFLSAKNIFTDVISLLEKENNFQYLNELRRTYLNLSNSFLKLGEVENAKDAASKSKAIAVELRNIDGEMRAGVNLGIALNEMGNTEIGNNELKNAYGIASLRYGKNSSFSQHISKLINRYIKIEYSYYIEQCQLCLHRGNFHDCGWCTDTDSSAGNGKVKLPAEDCGYPYHLRAHSSRQYFTKNNERVYELDGKNPPN